MAAASQHPAGETQSSRRLKYGLNVALALILAIALAALVNWFGNLHYLRKDYTASGQYSLAPQTQKIIGELKDDYQIVTLFRSDDANGSKATDLVNEYGRRSSHLTIDHIDPATDPDRLDAFYTQLKTRYAEKLKPMGEAVNRGEAVLDDLGKQAKEQEAVLQTVLESPGVGESDVAALVQGVAQRLARLRSEFETLRKSLKTYMRGEGRLPNYTAARDQLAEQIRSLNTGLYGLAATRLQKFVDAKDTPAAVKEPLLHAIELFKKSQKTITDAMPAIEAAHPIADYDELSTQIGSNPNALAIIGPKDVRVVAMTEMFRELTPAQRAAMQDQEMPETQFLGEERITGTLISMSLKSPPLVVFVFSGRQPALGPNGQYEQVSSRLQKLGFKVQQWSPTGQQGPMGQPMPPGPPPKPEEGQKAVWIVLPSEPPNPYNPMAGNGSEQVISIVNDRLAAGDAALFILAPAPSSPMAAGLDPIAQAIGTWGITPQTDRVILQEVLYTNRQKAANNFHTVSEWPADLPITKALNGMAGCFLTALPLEIAPTGKVKDVQTWPLVVIKGPDLWAEKNVQGFPNIKRDPATSAEAFTIGAAAESKTNRIIVVGDPIWATDLVTTNADARLRAEMRGSAELFGAAYPANAELFINGVLWLSHLDDLIAASARTQDTRRVQAISPGGYRALKWSLLAGMPLLIFASGTGVWLVRRRG